MSPSGLHIRSRRSQGCIRTISLTPSGVSSNSVLEFLIEDLVSGSTVGFDCIDACGTEVRVYFDITGFIGDYPSSSAAVDVSGHTSIAPCTHCSLFLKRKIAMSKYAITVAITSANSCYRKTKRKSFQSESLELQRMTANV